MTEQTGDSMLFLIRERDRQWIKKGATLEQHVLDGYAERHERTAMDRRKLLELYDLLTAQPAPTAQPAAERAILVRIKGEPRGYDDSFYVTVKGEAAYDANETEYPVSDLEVISQPAAAEASGRELPKLPDGCRIKWWNLAGAQEMREEDAGCIELPSGLMIDVGCYASEMPRPFRIGVYGKEWDALVEIETFDANRVNLLAEEFAEKYCHWLPAEPAAAASGEAERLRATIAQAWSKLTGWDAARIANGSHVASADPAAALLEACQTIVRERDQLRTLGSKQREEIENLNCMADAVERLRDIGRATGCDHVDDPDGRLKLVNCVEEVIAKAESERDAAAARLAEVEADLASSKSDRDKQALELATKTAALRFAFAKVHEHAGNLQSPFAYLFQGDWDEFKRLAALPSPTSPSTSAARLAMPSSLPERIAAFQADLKRVDEQPYNEHARWGVLHEHSHMLPELCAACIAATKGRDLQERRADSAEKLLDALEAAYESVRPYPANYRPSAWEHVCDLTGELPLLLSATTTKGE